MERQTREEFERRLAGFQPNSYFDWDSWETHPKLTEKVSCDGRLEPFFGDTVVYDLDEAAKEHFDGIKKELHRVLEEAVAVQPLEKQYLHLTLHDLAHGKNPEALKEVMEANAKRALKLVQAVREGHAQKIRVRMSYVFNMNNTSIVAGVVPADDIEYQKLMDVYEMFDVLCPLGHYFTPHVTLAYYKPQKLEAWQVKIMDDVVKWLSERRCEMVLDAKRLHYARFSDMNRYELW